MHKSDSISTIAAALKKAQHNIGAAVKDAANPFFKSRYADLGSVMAVCKAPLLAEGISVLQMVGHDDAGGYLETILLHESGEYISDRMPLVCAKAHDPQAMGSAITYARRYALQSALFIPAEDDDAEAAQAPTRALQEQDEAIGQRQERREAKIPGARSANDPPPDWRNAVIPFGKNKGRPLGELNTKQLEWYAEDWLLSKQESSKPVSAADRTLIEALLAYKRSKASGAEEEANRLLREQQEVPEPSLADLPF